MVKILVVGNGAREHAIIKALMKRADISIINLASGVNPGIEPLVEKIVVGNLTDMSFIEEVARTHKPDYAVVGPDDPIGLGASDVLWNMNIPSFAPRKSSARIESSKGFARDLLKDVTPDALPRFFTCTSKEEVMNAINALSPEYVVKADGLMGGKGVIVHGEHFTTDDEAFSFAAEALEKFGQVVLEEKLVGVEFSLMSFVSGETVVDMPAVQDHKRAYEGDTGPNTGGMGTYSDADLSLPFLQPEHLEAAHTINVKTVQALKEATGETYVGILYGGFMLTETGVKLIEYNARFGDPEAMNALSLLETPLADVVIAALQGTLEDIEITFEQKATVLKYIVPEGYPTNPIKGKEITIEEANIPDGVELYYASVTKEDGKVLLSSSRAIAVLGKGDSLEEAEEAAEKAVSCVHGPVFYRKDIGTMPLIQKRIDMVQSWD